MAVVTDVWSRRVVGWAMGETMTSDLVLAALNMAIQQRRPTNVIHHSDQGSQYTSIAFGERCRATGVQLSTGTVGDAYEREAHPWGAMQWPRASSPAWSAS